MHLVCPADYGTWRGRLNPGALLASSDDGKQDIKVYKSVEAPFKYAHDVMLKAWFEAGSITQLKNKPATIAQLWLELLGSRTSDWGGFPHSGHPVSPQNNGGAVCCCGVLARRAIRTPNLTYLKRLWSLSAKIGGLMSKDTKKVWSSAWWKLRLRVNWGGPDAKRAPHYSPAYQLPARPQEQAGRSTRAGQRADTHYSINVKTADSLTWGRCRRTYRLFSNHI